MFSGLNGAVSELKKTKKPWIAKTIAYLIIGAILGFLICYIVIDKDPVGTTLIWYI